MFLDLFSLIFPAFKNAGDEIKFSTCSAYILANIDENQPLWNDLTTSYKIKKIYQLSPLSPRPTTDPFNYIYRGQQFYHDNICAMFFSKILGLITTLAVPTNLQIVMFTKMSSTSYTAYKRYLSTIFHMCIWYDKDLRPGSE